MKTPEDAYGSVTATATGLPTDNSAGLAAGREPPLQVVSAEHYELGHEHARGGLGRIIVARDRRLERTVAVKELLEVEERATRRFMREARLTAKLQHPAIVPIHEAGRWPNGAPFYAMKFVSGKSLKQAIAERRSLVERLGLLPNFIAVAEAIAYAHSEKIIHRDLKPSNVLLGNFGETLVVDWGLAKNVGDADEPTIERPQSDLSNDPDDLTTLGSVIGTPIYMPPEQASGLQVDERADVYSLGAMLYHLLCGEPPFAGDSASVLAKVKSTPPEPLRLRMPTAPPELIAIVERAMQREPHERYATAEAFAQDLIRFQTGQLVRVHEYSLSQLVRRWLRKNRALAIAVATFVVVGLAYLTWSLNRESRLRHVAEQARDQSALDRSRAESESARANKQTVALLEDRGREELAKGHPQRAAPYLAGALRADPNKRAYRSLAAQALRAMTSIHWSSRLPGKSIHTIAMTADETEAFVATHDGTMNILSTASGATLMSWKADRLLDCAAFSPDGRTVIAGATDGTVEIWNIASQQALALRSSQEHHDSVEACIISSDSRLGFTGSLDGKGTVWDLATKRPVYRLSGGDAVFRAAFSPDNKRLAISRQNNSIGEIFDMASGKRLCVLRGHSAAIRAISFNKQANRILTSSFDANANLWRTDNCQLLLRMHHSAMVTSSSFANNDESVVTSTSDGAAMVWNLKTHDYESFRAPNEENWVRVARLIEDNSLLLTTTDHGVLRLFAKDKTTIFAIDYPETPISIAVSRVNGFAIIGTSTGSTYRINWRQSVNHIETTLSDMTRVVFSPSGNQIAACDQRGTILILRHDIATRIIHAHDAGVWRVSWSPDEQRLLSAPIYPDRDPKLWDAASGRLIATLDGLSEWVYSIAFSPDGTMIATAGRDGQLVLWDGLTGKRLDWQLPDAIGAAVAFSPDGRHLAVGLRLVQIWNLSTRTKALEWEAHAETRIDTLAYDPTGNRLVTAGWDDHLARIWNASTGALLKDLRAHTNRLMATEFSKDGQSVVTAGFDQVAKIWDASTGDLMRTIPGPTWGVSFSPDSKRLATGSGSSIFLWDVTDDTRSSTDLAMAVDAASPWALENGRLVPKAPLPTVAPTPH
jgi:WD40 repeat protein/serine/threonine protein kinase